MLATRELEAQFKAVAAVVREHFSKSVAPLLERITGIEKRLNELPQPLQGADGKSVTVEDVEPLIDQLVSKKVSEIPPAKNGESIPLEAVEEMVNEAVKKALQNISLPKDGEPGRDGAHIEILPAIDLEKKFPRGTFAKHLGGLWRSFETTTGMKGWECIVDGIADISFEKNNDRQYCIKTTRSSREQNTNEIYIPSMIYRGVFTPGDFEPGDTVTWAGSLWHCDEPTSDKPGEIGSKGWTLCAKKGRDGKDGINGKDFTKGVSIK